MNLIRLAWAIIALALISVVTCAPFLASKAEAATLADLQALKDLLPGGKMKINSVKVITIWRATVNTTTNCWRVVLPSQYTNSGQSFERWNVTAVAGEGLTEQQCYDAPLPK